MAPEPTYAITGIQDGLPPAGSDKREVPQRVEIDDFYTLSKYADQRNLFFLAMAKFQAMDPTEKLSYFQVAGIHGMPYKTWDDPNHRVPAPSGGYCPHNLITFPTWHRPYMLLFEQRVYEIMVNEVIPTFHSSDHERLKAAARDWRLPYWDWAAKKQRGDKKDYDAALILKDREVKVYTSTGEMTILNPIWQFNTPDAMGKWGIEPVQAPKKDKDDPYSNFIDFQICTATSKVPPGPDASTWARGEQNVEGVAENIRDHKWDPDQDGEENYCLGEAVYRLFSAGYISSYRQFASARYEPKQNARDALSWEGIHNNLHGWIGGEYGHMGHVAVAAFDPVFWMHHANIDRIFAIYQALYPTERLSWWVKDEITNKDGKTFVFTPESPLAPFHKDATGTTYDSNDVRRIVDLGYTYPELQYGKSETEYEYRKNIWDKVRELYAPPAKVLAARADYVVNVVHERFALDGFPFTVEILLDDKVVGSVYNFSGPPKVPGATEGCENCLRQQQSNELSSGQITLTGALLSIADAGILFGTLDKKEVLPYLQTHLKHRVLTAGGTEIPLSEIPSLKVSVVAGSRTGKILPSVGSLHVDSLPPPIEGGVPMSKLRMGDWSTESEAEDIWTPFTGDITYGHIFADAKGVYDTIEITPDTEADSEEPVKMVLTGFTEYEEVLSL